MEAQASVNLWDLLALWGWGMRGMVRRQGVVFWGWREAKERGAGQPRPW